MNMCLKKMENIKKDLKKCIQDFDTRFTKEMLKKQQTIPMLLKLYEQYEDDIYSPSILSEDIRKLQFEISNKIEEMCNDEQKELVNQLKYCIWAENDILVRNAFVYGYCVAQSLKDESITNITRIYQK